MRILVTGKNGQLGRSIHKVISTNSTEINTNQNLNEFVFVGRGELDLSQEEGAANYFNNNDKFDIIINCAAYTAVDKAEQEQELANQVNHLAVKQLAKIANKQQAQLIHISTDYVFDGESDKPYVETDKTSPINVYGKTKLAGDKALHEAMPANAIIIRTSWVYSEYGNNFVKTMLRLGKERDGISVVGDQIGSPTYATDLASVILEIIKNKEFREMGQVTQVYHYSNKGEISWYDFTKEIFKLEKMDCKVSPIESKDYSNSTARPHYGVMSKQKIKQQLELTIPYWKKSLANCLQEIKKS
jgi:dTDP-4-dehydrorhamnose reductase